MQNPNNSLNKSQEGIALITVMLILAVVTVALVSMTSDRQLDIRRTQAQLRSDQLWEFEHSIESWAESQIILDDLNNSLSVNITPEGRIDARLVDLQGRLNLNNLVSDDKVNEEEIQRLKRLFTNLDIKPELVDAIVDWVDKDLEIRYPNGAEDEIYTSYYPAYRVANTSLADINELLNIQGITIKEFNKISPFVYVSDGYEPVNVNTAEPEVLRVLAPNIKKNISESIYKASGKPFKKIEEFFKDEAMSGISVNKSTVSVESNNYLLSGVISMGQIFFEFQAQFKKNKTGLVTVVKRYRRSLQSG